MKNIKSFPEALDRTLAGGVGAQLKWFLVIILSVLAIFIAASFVVDGTIYGEECAAGKIKGIAYHFLDPGGLSSENGKGAGVEILVLLVVLSGMVLFNGLLISTITNIIERRVESAERGRTVYKNISNHYVIIGYGELTACIIEDILKHNGWNGSITYKAERKRRTDSLPKIILLTNQNIEGVREQLYSHLPKEVERRIFLYAGNIESYEHLSNLNIDKAKEVYILGEQTEYGRDSKNLDCVRIVSDLRGGDKDLLKVNVQFDKVSSYSIIQKITLPNEFICCGGSTTPNIFFRPFNFYENWARLLWGYTGVQMGFSTLDYEQIENEKYVHLVIAGFNRMGRALLFEALRLCHFPNFEEATATSPARNTTKITIIDKDMDDQLSTFLAQYPNLNQIVDVEIEFLNNRVEDTKIRKLLEEESLNKSAVLTVAICLKDPDYCMAVGLSLPNEVYYSVVGKEIVQSDTRVLIRQELQRGMGEVLSKNETMFKNVRTFGMLDFGINQELLNDDLAMYVSAYYDIKYGANPLKKKILSEYTSYIQKEREFENSMKKYTFIDWLTDNKHTIFAKDIATRLWLHTSEDFRFANRYQTDMYSLYDRYSGNPKLSQMEHLRWNADRSIVGYKHNIHVKDIDYKLHKLIHPFNLFTIDEQGAKEIEKDEDVINNMKKLLTLKNK